MSLFRLIIRSLVHYRRANLAVVFGAAVGVAVIVGSLLVGDAVRGSLRDLALERLSGVDDVLTGSTFFRQLLAEEIARRPEFADEFAVCSPAIFLEATIANAESGVVAARVTLLGVDTDFWHLANPGGQAAAAGPPVMLRADQAAVNQALANDLGLKPGQEIILAIRRPGAAAVDSLFGRRKRDETVARARLAVTGIVSDEALGRFSLRTGRAAPRNVYVSLPWLQGYLKHPGQVNTLLVAERAAVAGPMSRRPASPPRPAEAATGAALLNQLLAASVSAEDYGLRIVPVADRGYVSIESADFPLPQPLVTAIEQAAASRRLRAAPTSVYLANFIRPVEPAGGRDQLAGAMDGKDRRLLPYSIIAAVGSHDAAPLGLGRAVSGGAAGGAAVPSAGGDGRPEILLSAWAADDLRVRVGDELEVGWYQFSAGGQVAERSGRFRLSGIVPMTGPATDRHLAPDFEGITDANDLRTWEAPFPVDLSLIRSQDEEFWKSYRTAPKAFVGMEVARQFWQPAGAATTVPGVSAGSAGAPAALAAPRGPAPAIEPAPWITSVRLALPADAAPRDATVDHSATADHSSTADLSAATIAPPTDGFLKEVAAYLRPSDHGLAFRAVKAEALVAARGSSDFSSLFLGLSGFIVIAAALLVGLLMRLSIEGRANQVGILLATGLRPQQVRWLMLGEGLALAALAVVLGLPLGYGYARGILWALSTLWSNAVGQFPITMHLAPASLIGGAVAGLILALAATWWATRSLRGRPVLELLGGWQSLALRAVRGRSWPATVIAALCAAAGLAVITLAIFTTAIAAAPAYFLGGGLLLTAALAALASYLASAGGVSPATQLTLPRLAVRNLAVRRSRSLIIVALVAAASFVLATVAANRSDLGPASAGDRQDGAGGLALAAESDLPIFLDLNSPAGRRGLGFDPQDEPLLAEARVYAMRLRGGDDASCLNIMQPVAPRIVGLPAALLERGGFTFASLEPSTAEWLAAQPELRNNPWQVLNQPLSGEVPVIGDEASVRWILHKNLGDRMIVPGATGPVTLRIVGLLRGSIWQSELLMSEARFAASFGRDTGYRYFLIDAPASGKEATAAALRRGLGDLGLEVRGTEELLAQYAGVQNAYLSAFQSLGGLGLMLGTFGLVAVLLRSVIERRGELALMLAVGFRRRVLVGLLIMEYGALLMTGLLIGMVTGLAATAQQLAQAQAAVAWTTLAANLILIAVIGLTACAVTAAGAVKSELMAALRSQ